MKTRLIEVEGIEGELALELEATEIGLKVYQPNSRIKTKLHYQGATAGQRSVGALTVIDRGQKSYENELERVVAFTDPKNLFVELTDERSTNKTFLTVSNFSEGADRAITSYDLRFSRTHPSFERQAT